MQSVPVPMLVPNSNTEYRAMIGDRDADDTTDLSDNASDAEEEGEYKSDIKRVLDSRHIIGGKPKIDETLDYEPDSLTIIDTDDFEKADKDTKKVVDAINNELNDNHVEVTEVVSNKLDDGKDSVLILGIDSGPVLKAEFAIKEEIHRTLLNGNIDYAANLDAKMNGELDKDVVDYSSIKGNIFG